MTDDKTSTLKIPECSIDDEGDYEVVVNTAKGEATHMFETIVNVEQPKIVQSLEGVTKVSLHQPVELKVVFDSPVESKVTWLANGVALDSTPKYSISTTEQETTLSIADIIQDDTEMIYTCKVKNIGGQAETATSLTIPCKCSNLSAIIFITHYLFILIATLQPGFHSSFIKELT